MEAFIWQGYLQRQAKKNFGIIQFQPRLHVIDYLECRFFFSRAKDTDKVREARAESLIETVKDSSNFSCQFNSVCNKQFNFNTIRSGFRCSES